MQDGVRCGSVKGESYRTWTVGHLLDDDDLLCRLFFLLLGLACDAMREGPLWMAISCVTAKATATVHAELHSSDNVDHSLQFIPW